MKTKLIFSCLMLTVIGSLLKGQEFSTQNLLSNLNNYSNGFGAFAAHTSQNLPTGYGTLLGLRFWDGGGSDWRTQLAFGTDNNFYYRQSTNSNGASWTNWYNVYHSGNLNRNDINFKAKNLAIGQDGEIGTISGPANSGAIQIKTCSWAGGSNNRYLRLGWIDNNGAFSPHLSIIDGGYIGIGTTNPQNPLDVKGTIHAQEVKVDMNNWSDFVFHPSYQLKPLTEVEKFIKANGHLQDIPSADEVEQNGVNVGEMQKKLLQKVEELTLYVIEQQKTIEFQNQRIKQLEQKLNQ